MERLTRWNGKKWVLPQGRTSDGESYWRLIAERLAAYENAGEPGKREFFVDTPIGPLHIYAKHEGVDSLDDYPGVYIDIVKADGSSELLACVEFDSGNSTCVQSCLYDTGRDEPVVVHKHSAES